MSRYFVLLILVLILGACAYATDGSIQDLTVETPGAQDSLCHVYVDDLRYLFYPPQTVNIHKSREDLVIDCLAPGNRRKKKIVEAKIEPNVAGNVATGIVPGTGWDYLSESMFYYPDIVEVDFTGVKPSPEALPAQNNPDIRQPETYELEEFKAKRLRLNADKDMPPVEIRRRSRKARRTAGSMPETYITSGDRTDGKSSPDSVAPQILDPSGPVSSSQPGEGPVPLYPGD